MAKATKSATAPATPAAAPQNGPAAVVTDSAVVATPKAAKGIKPKTEHDGDKFVRVLSADGKGVGGTQAGENNTRVPKKMAPQAMVIANLIEAAGPAGMTRKAAIDALPAAGLVTRQPVGRILSYYQKPLIEAGMITVSKVIAPVVAPAAPTAA